MVGGYGVLGMVGMVGLVGCRGWWGSRDEWRDGRAQGLWARECRGNRGARGWVGIGLMGDPGVMGVKGVVNPGGGGSRELVGMGCRDSRGQEVGG